MSAIFKAIEKLKRRPSDLKWNEVSKIMGHYGYEILQGKGSRIKFYHSEKDSLVSLHKPHNPKTLRLYQIDMIINRLEEDGLI